jgi:hypothetical protein
MARSPYSSVSYYRAPNRRRRGGGRKRNPEFSLSDLMRDIPAAVGGVWLGRWAIKQSGNWEAGQGGQLEPGIKQAIAIWLAANVGSDLLGNLLGSPDKARIAQIACYGYGGDLFLRTRFMRDSTFVQNNLSLQGVMGGMAAQSQLGSPDSYVDSNGDTWVSTPSGWQLAGGMGQTEYILVDENDMSGMEAQSALGRSSGYAADNSFGYVR